MKPSARILHFLELMPSILSVSFKAIGFETVLWSSQSHFNAHCKARTCVCVCVGTRVEYQIKKCKIMTVPNTSNPPAIERNIRCFCPLSQRECGVHCAHNVHVTVLQKCARIRHAACSETAYIVICLSLTLSLSLSLSLPLKLLRNC